MTEKLSAVESAREEARTMAEQLSAFERVLEDARGETDDDDLVQGMVAVSLTTGVTLRGRVEYVARGLATVRPVVRSGAGRSRGSLREGDFPVHVATEHVVYVVYTDEAMNTEWP